MELPIYIILSSKTHYNPWQVVLYEMIELVDKHNFKDILPLIEAYQAFYDVKEISNDKIREFFAKFTGGNNRGAQFLYREGDEAVGFATIYFTYSSALTSKVAVLNDLYIKPGFRKQGKARELITHCLEYGLKHGAARLQWLTEKSNKNAQLAYDKIGAKKSEWILYTYAR